MVQPQSRSRYMLSFIEIISRSKFGWRDSLLLMQLPSGQVQPPSSTETMIRIFISLQEQKIIRYKQLIHLTNCTHRAETPQAQLQNLGKLSEKLMSTPLGMRHILVQQTCLVEEIVFISSSGIFKNNDITIYQLQCSYSSTILERRQSAIVQPYCNHTSSVVQPQLRKKYG